MNYAVEIHDDNADEEEEEEVRVPPKEGRKFSLLAATGEKLMRRMHHSHRRGDDVTTLKHALPDTYPTEWAQALTQERQSEIDNHVVPADLANLNEAQQYLNDLPQKKWKALHTFMNRRKWPYPEQHVGFVDPAIVELYDWGEPSLYACWKPFHHDLRNSNIVQPGMTLYQALKALIQLTQTPKYKPFGMRLSQMFTHSYWTMDQYGDIIRLLSEHQIDLTDFDSFPWHESSMSSPEEHHETDEHYNHFDEAVAVARSLHYYIDVGFRRVQTIAAEADVKKEFPKVRDLFLVSEESFEQQSGSLSSKGAASRGWFGRRNDEADEEEECVLSGEKRDWESWYINPNRVGLGINNAMSQLCYDRTAKKWRYDYGEWVEVRNYKMKWRITQVTERLVQTMNDKVIRHYDTNSDWDEIYESDRSLSVPYRQEHGCEATLAHPVPHIDSEQICIRLPQEALTRVFGIGPWIWQRWACLQLELVLRVSDDGHRHDLENLDILSYATELWTAWLYHKDNATFRELYHAAGASGQEELLRHAMDPFILMRSVLHNSDRWDFESAEVSVFLYTAMLGSGFFDAMIVVFLQVTMPLMLYFFYTEGGRNSGESEDLPTGTRMMLSLALLYYFYKISGDLDKTFTHMMETDSSLYSRLLALRRLNWDEGFESLSCTMGYILEVLQNSGYIVALYLFNIFVLFNSEDAFEILGNVVLFEFVYNLDESVASSEWWDDGRRFLKAGTVEQILAKYIRGRELHSVDTFVDYFVPYVGDDDIGADYLTRVKQKMAAMVDQDAQVVYGSSFLHQKTEDNPLELWNEQLLPLTQRIRYNLNESYGGANAPAKQTRFGPSGIPLVPNRRTALFQKHIHYRSWRLWSKVLFAAPPLNRRSEAEEWPKAPTPVDEPDKAKTSAQQRTGADDLAFPWDGKGPIIPRSFQSPGTLDLYGFLYPASSEKNKQRYTFYRDGTDDSYVIKRRTIFTFTYWRNKVKGLVEMDRASMAWKINARLAFNLVALGSWFLFYLFLPTVVVLSALAFTPFYCWINLNMNTKADCWDF